MKTFSHKTRFRMLALLLMSAFTFTTFANNLEKMESKPFDLVISSKVEFLLNTEAVFAEPDLDVEDWMLNPDTFLEDEMVETPLEVEAWMVDANAFVAESEPELALDNWMTDVNAFSEGSCVETFAANGYKK